MKTKTILLSPTGSDGGGAGGAGAGTSGGDNGAGGQGAGQGGGAGSGSSDKTPVPTAQRLWGGLVDDGKGAAGGDKGGKASDDRSGSGGSDGGTGAKGGGGAGSDGNGSSGGSGTPPNKDATGNDGKIIQLDEEMFGKLGKSIADSIKGPDKAPEISQEKFDQMFNIYRPNEKLMAEIRSDDPKVAMEAYQQLAHGAARQAVTIATHLLENRIAQVMEQFQPAMNMAQEREMEAMKVEFFEQNPDLKGLDPLLVLIRDQFVAKGTKFKSKEEAYKAVADEARKQMEALPGLKNGGAAGGNNAAGGENGGGNSARRMPTLAGGKGSGGAGDGSAASGGAAKVSTAKRIFG